MNAHLQRLVGSCKALPLVQPLRTCPRIQTTNQLSECLDENGFHTSVTCVLSILQFICHETQHARRINSCHVDEIKPVISVEALQWSSVRAIGDGPTYTLYPWMSKASISESVNPRTHIGVQYNDPEAIATGDRISCIMCLGLLCRSTRYPAFLFPQGRDMVIVPVPISIVTAT